MIAKMLAQGAMAAVLVAGAAALYAATAAETPGARPADGTSEAGNGYLAVPLDDARHTRTKERLRASPNGYLMPADRSHEHDDDDDHDDDRRRPWLTRLLGAHGEVHR